MGGTNPVHEIPTLAGYGYRKPPSMRARQRPAGLEVDLEGDPLSMQSLTGSVTALKSLACAARTKRPLEFANSITDSAESVPI